MTMLPLPVHPFPMSDDRLALLKTAKAQIATNVRVKPVAPIAGGDGAVLCFGEIPPFVGRFIKIKPMNVDNVDSVRAALEHWLADGEPTMDEAAVLSIFMGMPVTYSHDEDDTGKVVFR